MLLQQHGGGLRSAASTEKNESAYVLDIDLHFGDGTQNILGQQNWVTVVNVEGHSRNRYLQTVKTAMKNCRVDLIGISVGFDNHAADWDGLLNTEDYEEIGY